jgi:plastocyanin
MKSTVLKKMMGTRLNLIRGAWPFFLLAAFPCALTGQTNHVVDVTMNVFTPSEITIHAGETVTWTNSQGSHNVNGSQSVFPANPESFGNQLGTGWTYSHTFNIPGTYDYQCDPHVIYGMVGRVIVEEPVQDSVTIHFTGMGPHAGQDLWLAVTDKGNGQEVARMNRVVEEAFSMVIPGIEQGRSYRIDFYVDHNGNGMYDAPPADPAWRIEINDAAGDEIIDFAYNTNFTDIFGTTGVGSGSAGIGVSLYPVPARELLNIVTGLKVESVALISATGATLRTLTGGGSTHLVIPLDDLSPGLYFVEIMTAEKQQAVRRLVKK